MQREGGTPLVVQNNWMMGADNKRHRFREAGLWRRDGEAYYAGTAAAPLRLLMYSPEQPAVSPARVEPALCRQVMCRARAPIGRLTPLACRSQVSGLLRETLALRAALALAATLIA